MKKKEIEEKEKLPPDEQMRLDLYDWIQSLMVALVICIALFIFVVRVIDVSGSSMFPTLHNGDKMIVSNLFYKPKYGDVIVFKTDTYDPNKALVKRVIATEGQEISLDFDRGVVYIDGKSTDDMIQAMHIKTPSQKTQIRSLSGGNQQKVIFGRWILTSPDILLLDEPTRGIDVGAKYEIYELIQDLAKSGKSVIMVSSEMPELLGVCTRILVMSGGRLAGEVDADNTSQEEIMTLAAKYV